MGTIPIHPGASTTPTRRRFIRLVVGLLVVWVVAMLALSAVIYAYGLADHARPADVIIVLGSGLLPDGRPGPALTRRSQHAASLWHQGIAPDIVCTGGQTSYVTRSEADGCREVLLRQGIPLAAITLETDSHSTEENAIHTRELMALNGWEDAIVVSDSYHVFRANWLFNLEGVVTYTSPVPPVDAPFIDYVTSFIREILALHWQVTKELLNLPQTHVGGF